MDALLSIAQMPPGIPVATVAINGGVNAAVLAAEILAGKHKFLEDTLKSYKQELAEKVENSDPSHHELRRKAWEWIIADKANITASGGN